MFSFCKNMIFLYLIYHEKYIKKIKYNKIKIVKVLNFYIKKKIK